MTDPSRLADFLARLAGRTGDDLADAITTEVIETGGTLICPRAGDTWSGPFVEISLHGLSASGETLDEALAHWLAIAAADVARQERIEAAFRLAMCPDGNTAEALRRACETLLAESGDHIHHTRARLLQAALTGTFQIPA